MTTQSPAVNPLREGMRGARTPEPSTLVIFGASGDLTHRKLVPALYDLAREGLLPGGFSVVGFARRPKTDEQFRDEMREAISRHSRGKPLQPALWEEFASNLYYCQSSFDDPAGYENLARMLEDLDRETGHRNRLYYLATPPESYATIARRLGEAGLASTQEGWTRIIVEKPFGRDLNSAAELNQVLNAVFDEAQVYRIDHYLGKETVQNLLVFRFANGIFEPIWNRRYVDHVQITVAESIGVEGRGAYYENAGVIRDIVQNHVMQLMSLAAMEPPATFEPNAVRDEKVKVLRALRPIPPQAAADFIVRGQYAPGVISGEKVIGYRQEEDVALDSTTETYLAIKLFIDNWRWAGVPFYIRSGKALPKRVTEIAIVFRQPPLALFPTSGGRLEPNVLSITIQPDEGISLKFGSKVPGPGSELRIRPVEMEFRYGTSFGVAAPEAYERLLLDAMLGDATLYTRSDEVEAAWAIIMPVLEGWEEAGVAEVAAYEAGTWGPPEADDFIERDGRKWRRL
ncbi:MAG: glucose-6-phosphate dehydrogenase [Dehalococcoidia bacterium]